MTPKQTLIAHIHRYALSHYHAGPNLGPNDRPAGWYTGENAVEQV